MRLDDADRRARRRRQSPRSASTVGFGSFSDGQATGTDFTWSEVGIMRAVPGIRDGDYLTAGDVTGPPSELIGRFLPSRFVVDAELARCSRRRARAGGFTYQGQPFDYTAVPVITATAVGRERHARRRITRGAFFKLTNATLYGTHATSSPAAGLDTSGLPDDALDPAIASSAAASPR